MSLVKHFTCVNCKQELPSEEELDKHNIWEKIEAKQLIELSENAAISLSDNRMIYPALDANPDHFVITTLPFSGVRTKVGFRGQIIHVADTILTCVTSLGEYFEASQEEFLKRSLFARVPQPVLEQRWSAQSIIDFLFKQVEEVNPSDLFCEIREKFGNYIDFDGIDGASSFCALYTMGSYFYFLFEYFPYIKVGGEMGSGKSKLGKLFQAMAFNATNSGNQSEASIYRFARETRGTMIIDEGEDLQFKNDNRLAYQSVLLNGWERTGNVLRIDTEGSNRPERIPTYCPKIICSIGALLQTLDDRAFEIIIVKTSNLAISNREVHQGSKEWTKIRDSLYLCLMQKWKELQVLYDSVENDMEIPGRLWNIAKPLVVLSRFVDSYAPEGSKQVEKEIIRFIQEQRKEKALKADTSLSGSLVEGLESVLKEQGGLGQEKESYQWRIPVTVILDKVRELEGDVANPSTGKYLISAKRLTGLLKNFHIYREPRRDQANGSRSFLISLEDVTALRQRIGMSLTDDEKKVEHKTDGLTNLTIKTTPSSQEESQKLLSFSYENSGKLD